MDRAGKYESNTERLYQLEHRKYTCAFYYSKHYLLIKNKIYGLTIYYFLKLYIISFKYAFLCSMNLYTRF